MKDLHNIEKSGFHRGQYVGYAAGTVWRITKSRSSFGTWYAQARETGYPPLFAFRLADLSDKLAGVVRAHN